MKIMISQPMNGKTEKQIKDERKYLVQELEEQGHEVIDTIIKDFDDEVSPILYLAKSIEFLDKADAIVFIKGWEDARGCVIEHLIAEKYHKFIKEL
jgi:Asp-tRNA(Asn)/Glu-tRNA(Gln) amidotransferase A subunit family amidase